MPVDEAALDAFLASGGAPAETPAPEAPAAQEQPVESAPPVETHDDPAPDQDTFDRAYVEKLRRESASYRERAKKYQEAFDGYEDDQVGEWLRLAQQLRNDPRATAQELQTLVEAINQAYANEEAEAGNPTPEEVTPAGYLTQADVERMFAERERQADLQRRVAQIESDATSLGYEKGSEDYDELLWVASRIPSGSIHEAHAKLQAKAQAIYDRKLAELNSRPNPQVPAGTSETAAAERPKDFDSAAAALDAWIASR